MLSRRSLIASLALVPLARPAVTDAAEITYPTRLVRLVIGYPPGGAGDIVARVLGQWLQERLGQPFVIENRPGAASMIAAEAVAKAPADGYTLYWTTLANVMGVEVHGSSRFDLVRDIAPVAGIMRGPLIMEVSPSVPVKTVPELIAYAKGNPGKLSMASAGIGSTSHLAGELFKMITGVNMPHVPYRGSAPALTDLIAGQVQVMFDNITSSVEHVRAGKLRALAVTTATRSPQWPDLPAVQEFVSGYEVNGWFGIGAPKGTHAEVVAKINNAINAALADPKIAARIADLGCAVFPSTPADFGTLFANETEKWDKVIRFAGLKVK